MIYFSPQRKLPAVTRRATAFAAVAVTILSLLAFPVATPAMAKKKKTVVVRIHAEANSMDGERFAAPIRIPYPPYEIHISKIPIITEWEVDSFRSYPREDGTYGALLNLTARGKLALETTSLERPRTFLVVMVNGRMLDAVFIDRPVRDGRFFIKSGLLDQDLVAFGENFKMQNELEERGRINAAKAEGAAAQKLEKKAVKERQRKKDERRAAKRSGNEAATEEEEGIMLMDETGAEHPATSDSLPVEQVRE